MQEQRGTPLTDPDSAVPDSTRPPRRAGLVWGVLLVAALIDQGTKWWALTRLEPGVEHRVLGDLLSLRLTRNPGAAFSVLDGMTYAVTLVALAILARLLWLAHTRVLGRGYAWVFGLVAGGAIGNLIDRLVREPGIGRGHVVDFIDYAGLFVGNVADIFIVGAALAGALLVFAGRRLDGSSEPGEAPPGRGRR